MLPALPLNIRPAHWVAVTNALAYSAVMLVTTVNSFTKQAFSTPLILSFLSPRSN
jgi:hypothetical protein